MSQKTQNNAARDAGQYRIEHNEDGFWVCEGVSMMGCYRTEAEAKDYIKVLISPEARQYSKLFIVSFNNRTEEFWQYSRSIAELALTLQNSGMDVRAIEQIPHGTVMKDMRSVTQLQEALFENPNA